MSKPNRESFNIFETFIAKTDNTYAFNDETSIEGMGYFCDVIKDMGLDPMNTEDYRKGLFSLFNIEILEMPDLKNNNYIFTPNHVSDFDALVLGVLHPKIRIVSKNDWVNNDRLKRFLSAHYDLYGFERTSLHSIRSLLVDSTNYFNDCNENKHYLLFSQGTISDFNNNSIKRISSMAQKISNRTGIPIVNIFIEQVSLHHPTRIIFDKPMKLTPQDNFRMIWLERERALQKALIPPARSPRLTHKHSNNNKPEDPFF